MVDIVVIGVAADRDPRQGIAAMVIHVLECRHGKEDHALPDRQLTGQRAQIDAHAVHKDVLERVYVGSAVRIRNIQEVVLCMDVL